MTFDIIDITDEEARMLETIQLKLLRTAQQKKDALYHSLQQELEEYRSLTLTAEMQDSSLYSSYERAATAEYNYQVDILREQLLFNLSIKEPSGEGEVGESGSGGDTAGYVVDYNLSYLERYVAVRDYYMTVEDPDERISLYAADEVAMRYLDSYYTYLFNYLVQFT